MTDALNDFQLSFQHIELLIPRINKGIQVIYVLSGQVKVETSSRFYQMSENDFLVINHNENYQAQGDEQNRVMLLSISDSFMIQHYPDYRNHRFELFSREIDYGREEMIHSIRKLLANMMISYFRQDESYRIEVRSYIYQLLLIFIRRFKAEDPLLQKVDTSDVRILQIIDYCKAPHYPIQNSPSLFKFFQSVYCTPLKEYAKFYAYSKGEFFNDY